MSDPRLSSGAAASARVVLSLAALAPLAGCAAAAGLAAGAAIAFGAIKYRDNRAEMHFEQPIQQVYPAVVDGLVAAGYRDAADHARMDGNEAEVDVGNVEVDVSARSPEVTRVRVRVGTFETDESKAVAERILTEIRSRVRS